MRWRMKNPPWQLVLGGLWDVFRCQSPSRLRERIEDGVDGASDLGGRFILARLDLASDAIDEVLPDVGFLADESGSGGACGVGDINGVAPSLNARGCGLAILPFVASGCSADGLSTMGLVSARDSSYLCHVSHSILAQFRGRSAIFAECAIPTGPHPTNTFTNRVFHHQTYNLEPAKDNILRMVVAPLPYVSSARLRLLQSRPHRIDRT